MYNLKYLIFKLYNFVSCISNYVVVVVVAVVSGDGGGGVFLNPAEILMYSLLIIIIKEVSLIMTWMGHLSYMWMRKDRCT